MRLRLGWGGVRHVNELPRRSGSSGAQRCRFPPAGEVGVRIGFLTTVRCCATEWLHLSVMNPQNSWIAAATLASLLMLNSGVKFAEVVHFFRYREAIATEMCVNRGVVGSCCKGSCQVARRVSMLDGGSREAPAEPVDGREQGVQGTVGVWDRARWLRGLRSARAGRQLSAALA